MQIHYYPLIKTLAIVVAITTVINCFDSLHKVLQFYERLNICVASCLDTTTNSNYAITV